MLDLIIIGAGPYGISLAAHAAKKKLSYKLFGYPMDFWKNKMPQNMFIRTPHDLVSFSDPDDEFTIQRFAQKKKLTLESPLPRTIFIEYGMWFAEKTGVLFTPQLVVNLKQEKNGYRVYTEAGENFVAKNVVIAVGVEHSKYIPKAFQPLSDTLVSHTSGYTDFNSFKGKDVVVIGSGQSAWEAAALLHTAGAHPELIYRGTNVSYSGSRVSELGLKMLGNIFYRLPRKIKRTFQRQSKGNVASFLRAYVKGKIPETPSAEIIRMDEENEKVRIHLSNGEERLVNHILLATGFQLSLDKVSFIDSDIKNQIHTEENSSHFPKLNEHFQSNLPGLYFVGPLSSHSHGPTFRFILGLKKTSLSIMKSIVSQKVNKEEIRTCCMN